MISTQSVRVSFDTLWIGSDSLRHPIAVQSGAWKARAALGAPDRLWLTTDHTSPVLPVCDQLVRTLTAPPLDAVFYIEPDESIVITTARDPALPSAPPNAGMWVMDDDTIVIRPRIAGTYTFMAHAAPPRPSSILVTWTDDMI